MSIRANGARAANIFPRLAVVFRLNQRGWLLDSHTWREAKNLPDPDAAAVMCSAFC